MIEKRKRYEGGLLTIKQVDAKDRVPTVLHEEVMDAHFHLISKDKVAPAMIEGVPVVLLYFETETGNRFAGFTHPKDAIEWARIVIAAGEQALEYHRKSKAEAEGNA